MTRTGRSRLEHRHGWLDAVMALAFDRPPAPEGLALAKFSLFSETVLWYIVVKEG